MNAPLDTHAPSAPSSSSSLPPPPPGLPNPVVAVSLAESQPPPSFDGASDLRHSPAQDTQKTHAPRAEVVPDTAASSTSTLHPPAPSHSTTATPPQQRPLNNHRHSSHFSSNLLSAFRLDSLAASVARHDSQTGEKINKMRKSYEGHLKSLALAGKNKSVRHEDSLATAPQLMSLVELAAWPDEEWHNQKVHGKSVRAGLPDGTKSKIDRAVALQPGIVPQGSRWEDILGLDRPLSAATSPVSLLKPSRRASAGAHTANGTSSGGGGGGGGGNEHIRARRSTKKRRYDDGSFEGYGEGWADDDVDFDGYDSGDTHVSRTSHGSGGGGGGARKRRKTRDFGSVGSAGSGAGGGGASYTAGSGGTGGAGQGSESSSRAASFSGGGGATYR